MSFSSNDYGGRAGGFSPNDPGHFDPPDQVPPDVNPGEMPHRAPPRGGKNPALENLEALGTTHVPTTSKSIHTLSIVGQVEGHLTLPPQNKTTKYEHVIPQLVAVEQNPEIEGLLVILNTVGGDVEAGLAIAEMLASLSKPSVSLVLGGGHSIGVPIAVSTTFSFIASTATMTIHPIRLTGLVIGVPLLSIMHMVRTDCTSCFGSASRRAYPGSHLGSWMGGRGWRRWRRPSAGRSVRLCMSCA